MSGEARQRRLPTKTRSGIITLPTATNTQATITDPAGPIAQLASLLDDDDELMLLQQQLRTTTSVTAAQQTSDEQEKQPAQLQQRQQQASCQVRSPSPPQSVPGEPSSSISPSSQPSLQIEPQMIQPEEEAGQRSPCSEPQPAVSCSLSDKSSTLLHRPPRRKGGPSLTGPLNASTAPAVVSLPVKRRGSYQNLKKQMQQESHSNEDSTRAQTPNRATTHWERFGTILVLYCAQNKVEHDELVQMMSVEGYDTEIVDNQLDALAYVKSREVFPDVVVIDTDHTYNTIQLIKQLQSHLATISIIVMGSSTSRPNAVTALQAGASDYVRKPVIKEEFVARIERHVQRQHSIKLELEEALEEVKRMMAQLKPSAQPAVQARAPGKTSKQGLGAVAETDFEEQMSELFEENQRLASRLKEAESRLATTEETNRRLQMSLGQTDLGVHANSDWPAAHTEVQAGQCGKPLPDRDETGGSDENVHG